MGEELPGNQHWTGGFKRTVAWQTGRTLAMASFGGGQLWLHFVSMVVVGTQWCHSVDTLGEGEKGRGGAAGSSCFVVHGCWCSNCLPAPVCSCCQLGLVTDIEPPVAGAC